MSDGIDFFYPVALLFYRSIGAGFFPLGFFNFFPHALALLLHRHSLCLICGMRFCCLFIFSGCPLASLLFTNASNSALLAKENRPTGSHRILRRALSSLRFFIEAGHSAPKRTAGLLLPEVAVPAVSGFVCAVSVHILASVPAHAGQ